MIFFSINMHVLFAFWFNHITLIEGSKMYN
jgi:hypothetical protein